jgi:anthraniloyl-CoA monooxygenase
VRIVSIGGGPAGLYFGILRKKQHPNDEIVIVERNMPYQTFGWGVVFSDETLGYLAEADPETHRPITETFAHWEAIDIHYRGECVRSVGHGFSGIARKQLLNILQRRAEGLGIKLAFEQEITGGDIDRYASEFDLVLGADGVKSVVRTRYASTFGPSLDFRNCRYIWLGTDKRFDAFTFIFEQNEHGLFQVHAYPFDAKTSTFIVECDEATYRAAGFEHKSETEIVRYLEQLFAKYLDGHELLTNRSSFINFVTIRNQKWHHDNVVLMGDAAHTAHFSIGSGTKLAMEDSIALAKALDAHDSLAAALVAYEEERRPIVERTQRAAQDSLLWFENTKRFARQEPLQFAFNLLSRSKRITFENLRLRDPLLIERVALFFESKSRERLAEASISTKATLPGTPKAIAQARQLGAVLTRDSAPPASIVKSRPPMFTPFRLRNLTLDNRVVVSPMCMYSAQDGTPNDFHLVHLGSRAIGGAGLVFTEMTNVSREGRISPGCTGMYKPEHVRAWKRVVDFVHGHTRAKICLQLGHAGRKGSTKILWEGMDEPLTDGAWPILAASPIPYLPHSQVPKEADRDDMDKVVADFVQAARWADEAGFDMLEVHAAHGYLLASFLSPVTNQRADEYGGSLENRLRFPLEVVEAVRAAWPERKPLSVRISACDWVDGGITEADVVALARALKGRGCDVINVSTGQTTRDEQPVYGRMFQARFSDLVRNEAAIPTIVAGNITTADQVDTILAAGRADLVALARPHLDDPHFTLHAAKAHGIEDHFLIPQYQSVKPKPPVSDDPSSRVVPISIYRNL